MQESPTQNNDRLAAVKSLGLDPNKPFTFTSQMTIKPEHIEDFKPLLKRNTELAVQQPACDFIYANQSIADPGVFLMFERWTSLIEFEQQETRQPWFAEYIAQTEYFHERPRIVTAWTDLGYGEDKV